MDEVEAVFGIWLVPLFVAIIVFHGWSTMVDYVGHVNVADAIFVVVIMAIASSLPILRFTETVIAKVSAIGSIAERGRYPFNSQTFRRLPALANPNVGSRDCRRTGRRDSPVISASKKLGSWPRAQDRPPTRLFQLRQAGLLRASLFELHSIHLASSHKGSKVHC